MIAVDGATLDYEIVGAAAKSVVMLHGGPGAAHNYLRPQLDELAEPGERRLIYYDQRGCGKSTIAALQSGGSAYDHVADLEALRQHFGLRRLHLVGYSWGGLLALLYAIRYPEHVGKLALLSTAPAAAAERPEARQRLQAAAQRPEVLAMRARLDPTNRQHRFALAVAGYFADPTLALQLTPFLVQQRAEEAVWRSLGEYDIRPALQQLRLDALMIHGELDPIPIDTAERTAEALAAPLVRLSNCGHVPYIEAPEAMLAALRGFFADLAADH